MSDSVKVQNAAQPSGDEAKKDFARTQSYDPNHLKRIGLWDKGKLKGKDFFGKMGITLSNKKEPR